VGKKTDSRPSIDIWAIGVLIYVMLFGVMPFNGDTRHDVIKSITQKEVELPKGIVISDECEHLLQSLLAKNPDKRIQMLDIQMHPWFELDDSSLIEKVNDKAERKQARRLEEEKKVSSSTHTSGFNTKKTMPQKPKLLEVGSSSSLLHRKSQILSVPPPLFSPKAKSKTPRDEFK